MKKFGKKYVEASKKLEKNKEYSVEEAIKLVKETSITKFDSSVDIAIKLNVDPKNAGDDYVGEKDMIEKIQKENWFDFDIIIATPDMMPELGKIGMILGPKGLMPNPKTNTVTTNVAAAVSDVKKGMVSFKTDTFGNIHSVVGKVSFDETKLKENLEYIISTISKLKPASVKGKFINSITIASTMGPGIRIDKNSFDI